MATNREPGMTWRESIAASVMTAPAAVSGRKLVSASRASARVSILLGGDLLPGGVRRDMEQDDGLMRHLGEDEGGGLRAPDGGGEFFEPDVDHEARVIHRPPTDEGGIRAGGVVVPLIGRDLG